MIRRYLIPTLVGLALALALAIIRLADPYPVQVARATTFDFFQQLSPRPPADAPVRVVDIDDASLTAIGQWPWPRDLLATMTNRLGELGAAVVGFDMLFAEPDRLSPARLAGQLAKPADGGTTLPDYDQTFAAALSATPSLLGFAISPGSAALPGAPKVGFAISGTDPTGSLARMRGAVLPLPSLQAAAQGLGGLSLDTADSATVVRRVPLLWSAGTQLYPSLAIEALRLALGVKTIVVFGDTAGQGYVDSLRVGDLTIPTTADGDLTLYYSKPDASLFISAKDLLGPQYRDLEPRVKGQIVLVGTSASGLLDLHTTTLGDNVPGVSIHAEVLRQILAGAYLTRTDWVSGLEIASFLVIGILVVLLILRVGPVGALLIGTALLSAMIATSWFLFRRYGLLLDPSFPVFGTFVLYSAMVFFRFAITDADRRQIRRAFGHYVAPSLLAQIERSGDRLKLGGEVRELTVMFADVRGFTSISEKLQPEELLQLLNTLFGALGAEVTTHSGTIDKFIGDALMAFWNAPVDVSEHGRQACLAALGMRQRLTGLNASDAFGLKARGGPVAELSIGIGISTGEALVGNMGLETRFDYSCIGDTVNVASRVEGACKTIGYDIVVVEETRAAAPDLAYLEAGSLLLKGKSARAPIHILVGDRMVAGSAAFLALGAAHAAAIEALRADQAIAEALGRCRELCEEIDPRLGGFYDLLAQRAADFRVTA